MDGYSPSLVSYGCDLVKLKMDSDRGGSVGSAYTCILTTFLHLRVPWTLFDVCASSRRESYGRGKSAAHTRDHHSAGCSPPSEIVQARQNGYKRVPCRAYSSAKLSAHSMLRDEKDFGAW